MERVLNLKSEGFRLKNWKKLGKLKKIQNFSKFWGFPLTIRFFGFLHILEENGCKNRLKVVWTSKTDARKNA